MRVYWTEEEVTKLAQYLVDHDIDIKERGFVAKLRKHYQTMVFPQDRQRQVSTHDHVKEVTDRYQVLVAEKVKNRVLEQRESEERAKREAQEAIAREKREVHEQIAHLQAELELARAQAERPHPLDLLLDGLATELATRFVTRVRTALETAMVDLTPSSHQDEPFEDVFKPHIPKDRKPKILVVGLKGGQIGLIENEYGKRFDLRFVDSGRGAGALTGKFGTMDVVLGMTDFSGHDKEYKLKGHQNYKRVRGGMDSLRQELNCLIPA